MSNCAVSVTVFCNVYKQFCFWMNVEILCFCDERLGVFYTCRDLIAFEVLDKLLAFIVLALLTHKGLDRKRCVLLWDFKDEDCGVVYDFVVIHVVIALCDCVRLTTKTVVYHVIHTLARLHVVCEVG